MLNELITELNKRGINFIKTVDISMLSSKENMGYGVAILIGINLSPGYIFRLSKENISDHSEFGVKEHLADELAEWTADFIIAKGYKAFAQSERNLIHGFFDETTKTTSLPHKKIAMLAGLGWIGKSNLLVTKEYGSALCMCTVLTNAPIPIENQSIIMPKCGECTVCKDICPTGVIHGSTWKPGMNRDLIVDVYHCDGCLKCLINCPWTQKYMQNNITK
ncbi:epoxyqueuosine reductase [Clostridium folliculivorans]|uniref:Iron-sulfur-binding protein n=1 Tax=Clostridium folliculivorans TaxID=2886038 RepID=A0A9W5Y296_9CLOT|nr:epoxyqueuosine reductase [Clostridium folliculivorans]GKU25207.1 iron-sulfur-binding protein [Clostridium folliculivorans]GKU31305.1 iron-sulfur-binding protein [Clostridium folliculivorans]